MSRLTKGIFGYETDYKKTPLNLVNNQTRVNPVVYTGGWYNLQGERLGCGDLTIKDLVDISKKLHPSESFLVMTEADSIWNLPKELDRSAPGVDYVLKHMCWVVAANTVIKISPDIVTDKIVKVTKDSFSYLKAGRKAVCNALVGKPKPPPPVPVADLKNLTSEQLAILKKQIAQIKMAGLPTPGLAKPAAPKTPIMMPPKPAGVGKTLAKKIPKKSP